MATWDTQPVAVRSRRQDAAVRNQIRHGIGPFSPYWRGRFRALGISASTVCSVDDLARLPAVGERDVSPDGDPGGMAALVLQASEAGYALHGAGPMVRRALLRRLVDRDAYRRVVEMDTRPTTFTFTGLGFQYPIASTRGDLDLIARAGRRLWEVLGLGPDDVLVVATPPGATGENLALSYAALASGADAAVVAATLRLVPARVLAAPAAAAADLIDDLAEAGVDLSAVHTLLLVGAPSEPERRAAVAAITAVTPAAVVLAVHAPAGARVLWGECRASAGRPVGYHTYPDLEVVQDVAPDTGEVHREGPAEPVVTQLRFRGSALVRWRTGDVAAGPVDAAPCPACRRTLPRVPSQLRRAALVPSLGPVGGAVDLRAVAGALFGRPDLLDWRIEIGTRSRDDRTQLVVHYLTEADPAEAAVRAAADIKLAAGTFPAQLVAAEQGELPRADGALGARFVLRR